MIKDKTSITFKRSFFLGLFLLSTFNLLSQVKEIVPVDVNKECKKHIQKEFYKNETASTYVRLVFEMKRSANLHFEYKEHKSYIYIHCNDEIANNFHTNEIFLNINNKEFILKKPRDKRSKRDVFGTTTIVTFIYGFEMSESLNLELSKAESISFQLIKKSDSKRAFWNLSTKKVKNINAKINCFNNHISPIKDKYDSEQKRIHDAEIALQLAKKERESSKEKERLLLSHIKNLELAKKDSLLSIENAIKIEDYEKTYSADFLEALKLYNENSKKGKKYGALISQFDVTAGSYDIGTDITLGVTNYSQKRIKYVEFKLRAFNPVNDQVGSVKTVKGVGFVYQNLESVWEFESVWYQSTVSSVKII